MEELTAIQREMLIKALLSAFPGYDDLDYMLQLGFNQPLSHVSGPAAMPIVGLRLVQWAESSGELDPLIAAALRQRPKNPKLKALVFELVLNAAPESKPILEAIVAPNVPMQDPVQWRARMERFEQSVCRIEMPTGNPAGSGFLIAEDLVLTNCHVAAQRQARGVGYTACAARFGAKLDAAGAEQLGEAFAFADMAPIAESAISALDYAVIRLAASVDRPAIPRPTPHAFEPNDIYFILQHPLGQQMKLSAGTFQSFEPATARVRYTANTNPGSSGSPVFDVAWNPVALHHAGTTSANAGVVLTTVAADAGAAGWSE